MMHNTVIIRYGELALKGKNRSRFESRLVLNIRDCLMKNKVAFESIYRKRGRIFIKSASKCSALSNVFGISSFSYALMDGYSIESIKKNISLLLKDLSFTTFRVTAKRLDDSVAVGSMELNRVLGQFIVDEYKKKVSLKHFDVEVGVEVIDKKACVFASRVSGPGGLPLGINGRAFASIENRRSNLAAWLMMKRGLRIYPVSTAKCDISILEKYNYGFLPMECIHVKRYSELGSIAGQKRISAIVTGHTLRDMKEPDLDMLMLQPLVGFSDAQISEKLKYL